MSDTNIEPLTAADIEAWATAPGNRDRARALGMRLISNPDPNDLTQLESLGDFEDQATTWAIENQGEARMLIIKLISQLA